MKRHGPIALALFLLFSVVTSAYGDPKGYVTYKPPLIPIEITLDTNGNIDVSASETWVTPLGSITVGLSEEDYSVLTLLVDGRKYQYAVGGRGFDIDVNGLRLLRITESGGNITVVASRDTPAPAPSPLDPDTVPATEPRIDHSAFRVAADWRRTVVFIFGETVPGQMLFIRGGIESSNLKNCHIGSYDCAIPIRHRNRRNDTKRWKVGDEYLDWMGAEPRQTEVSSDIHVYGTPLDWTTDRWPSEWGPAKTVDWDGHGEEKLNRWGRHYWMLDVDMDCTRTANGWFEFTSYITGGPGGEREISQPGTPYSGKNHFAKCGGLSVFRRNQDSPEFIGQISGR